MIDVKDKKKCTGCHACMSVCPRKCIRMMPDEEGFLYPQVDKEQCIGCGACEKVCPVLHPSDRQFPLQVYAARNWDEDVRMSSSSGGVFTLLAREIIRRGGVVFGASFAKDWQVVHSWTEQMEGLAAFQGAKYVQSLMGDTYLQVCRFLKQGRWVLFSGTPCQVAGLKHFLRTSYERLLTVDVVCHGVPSPLVWRTYLDSINPCNAPITALSMRDKSRGWKQYGMEIRTEDTVLYTGKAAMNLYSQGYLDNLYLRPSCYACPVRKGRSHSDLTLGDFWGIERVYPSMDDNRGTGLVLVNTPMGMNFYRSLLVLQKEVTYEQALRGNPSLEYSAPLTEVREEFWRRFPAEGMKVVSDIHQRKRKIWVRLLNRIYKMIGT